MPSDVLGCARYTGVTVCLTVTLTWTTVVNTAVEIVRQNCAPSSETVAFLRGAEGRYATSRAATECGFS